MASWPARARSTMTKWRGKSGITALKLRAKRAPASGAASSTSTRARLPSSARKDRAEVITGLPVPAAHVARQAPEVRARLERAVLGGARGEHLVLRGQPRVGEVIANLPVRIGEKPCGR